MSTAVENQDLHEEHAPGRGRATPEELVGAGLMLAMVVILFVQVISRFVFSSSLSWSEEAARYLFIWLIFLCLGSVTLRGEHIVIDVLTARLAPPMRRIFETVALAVALVLNLLLLYLAGDIALIFLDVGQTSAALGIPMAAVYAALPVGMLIATGRTIQLIIRLWRTSPAHLDEATADPYDQLAILADPVLESAASEQTPHPRRDAASDDVEGDAR